MPIENEPLKTSIQQRLEKERLELFEEKQKKKRFNIQLFIIFSIILGLILTVIQIYLKLFG